MAEKRETHFFTDLGALCGALPPYRWSLNETQTTCWACRALLEAGIRQRRAVQAGASVTARKVRG